MTRSRWSPGWIVAGVFALLLAAAIFGDTGVLHLWRLRSEVAELHREAQALEAENERLTQAITELRSDPAAIERIAREELGLVRPGERVLRFPRTSPPADSDRPVTGPPAGHPRSP